MRYNLRYDYADIASTYALLIIFPRVFQVAIHNIRLPKQSTVGDVINELKRKVC